MRHILKSSIALALGAAVVLGSLTPSFARGGIRYQDLQDSRGLNENGGFGFWQRDADDARLNGIGTWDRSGRPMQFY